MKKVKGIIGRIKANKTLGIIHSHLVASEMGLSSIAVAFYLLMSLFPLLITLGNMLPFLAIDHSLVMNSIRQIMPHDVYVTMGTTIHQLLYTRSSGLLSASALATLWASSQGVSSLQQAINKAYGVEKNRNFLVNRIVGVLVILLLFIVAFVGVVVIGFGQDILRFAQQHIPIPDSAISIFVTTKWPLALVGVFLVMVVIYLMVPNVHIPKFRYILPGACIAAIGTLLLAQVFGIYTRLFDSRSASYQVIGSFIVLMLWLMMNARVLILGAIINSVYQEIDTGEKPRARNVLAAGLHHLRNRRAMKEESESQ